MSTRAEFEFSDRSTAVIVGILFVVATAFLFIGETVYKPILQAPDVLQQAYPQRTQIITGVLLEFACILAMPLLAIFLFPVLRRYSEALAIGYVVFRTLEAGILSIAATNKLALIDLSKVYLDASDATAAMTQLAEFHLAANSWGDTAGLLYNIIFIIGAFILYTALFRSALVPRAISVFGFIGAGLLAGAVLASPYVEMPLPVEIALIIPIAVQEMVMAAWFIFKGFKTRAETG